MIYILVFLGMTALDICYTQYVKDTADRKAFSASNWAAVLILVSGFVTTSYVADPWLLIPAAFGAFAGTWISIKYLK